MERGWTKELRSTKEELEMLIMETRKELLTNKYLQYIPYYVVYGRKPGGHVD